MDDTNQTAPIGTEPSQSVTSNESGQTAIDISDDTLLNIQGHDGPVKYSDLFKSQQADYTRKTQTLAQERKQWEAERAKFAEATQAEKARLQTLAAELMQSRNAANAGPNLADQLSSMQFVDGKTGAAMVKAFTEEGLMPIVNAIKQRDEKINLLSGQLAQLSTSFQKIQGSHSSAQFENRIAEVMKEVGLPSSAAEFAKDVYLSYEPGPQLDQQFPELLKQRWAAVTGAFEQSRKEKAEAAKRDLMFPGKGGQGTAASALGLTGNENAKQTTDAIWERLQAAQSQET